MLDDQLLSCGHQADLYSFVEEDHQYKVMTRARQDARQRPQPGRPSGDAMSFWGKSEVSYMNLRNFH